MSQGAEADGASPPQLTTRANSNDNAASPSSPSSSSAQKRRRSGSRTSSPEENVEDDASSEGAPPLPDEDAPPLPDEAPPEDDGWDPVWDPNAQAYYFYNRYTQASQWENPRVPEATTAYERFASSGAPGTTTTSGPPGSSSPPKNRYGGYNPAIHGSYDPNADYAVEARKREEAEEAAAAVAAGLPDPTDPYAATAQFNRFTGRFQSAAITPDNYNDENKSKRQMSAFFDVDAAANSHNGRSLREERRNKALSKKELKAFKEKRREKKEEKRRAWLRD